MIQVELHDRAHNLVRILSGAKNAAYYAQLNLDGAGSFKIHRSDPDVAALGILKDPPSGIEGYIVHLLRKGPYETAFTDRFSFQVEGISFGLDQGEEQNAWITVAGRGTLSLLEDRICFPPGFDGVNPATITSQWQIYAGVAGGQIMSGEIARSAARFALAIGHNDVSTVLQTVKLRFDNLRLLHDFLVQSGPMDAQMLGLTYNSVDHRGTDKSALVTVQMAPQDSMLSLQLQRDAKAVKNWIIAQGTGEGINSKLSVSTDAPSIAALRRREGFQDCRQIDNQTQLNLTAAGILATTKAIDQRIMTKFSDSLHTQLYRDFDLGDVVGAAAVPIGLSSKYRVIGIQVADVDAEIEDVSLDLNSMRQEYLIKLLQGTVMPAVGSLSVLNRQPQGSAWNDTQTYPDNCGPSFPFHFNGVIPTNVLQLNYAKLSFFLQAFRGYEATSAGGSLHGHSVSGQTTGATHNHQVQVSGTGLGTLPLSLATGPITWATNNTGLTYFPSTLNASSGESVTGVATTNESAHTHAMVAGIYESTVATGVTVKINGIDRTVALGGGSGFTTNQQELDVTQWMTIGSLNTVDLTPTGLGRILGSLRLTGYIQAN